MCLCGDHPTALLGAIERRTCGTVQVNHPTLVRPRRRLNWDVNRLHCSCLCWVWAPVLWLPTSPWR